MKMYIHAIKELIFSLSIVVVLGLVGCSRPDSEQKSQTNTPPNIIWLMSEDISVDLECYGMPAVKTPYLNKMAAQGVKFQNCFVTNSICSPSRSAMLVGVHQNKINAQHHRSNRQVPLAEGYYPFTYHLRKAGYTTILGHHGVMGKGRKIDVNFKHEPLGDWDGQTKFGLFDKYDTFTVADQPFFAQIQLKVTHRGDWWDEIRNQSAHPVNPDSVELPPYMADHPVIRLDWAKYLDQLEYMDAEVGMIFKELEEKGLADNTIVIFVGDNGRCNIRGKGYLHDPGLRIPLLVYDPNGLSGQVRDDVISATDITATVLSYAGVDIPDYMTGRPIFDEKFERSTVYSARDLWDEVEEQSRSVTTQKWKYIRNDKPEVPFDAHQGYLEFYRPAVHVMRTLKTEGKLNASQSFFFQDEKPTEELYDLEKDPYEEHNLALNPEYTTIVANLRNELGAYEEAYAPISQVYEPITPNAVELLEWVKKEKPALYQQMQEGVEIGFQALSKAYKQAATKK
ncbi:sulfatase [Reichenbachiella carrageenanivorans]|uniref:Sulfatase n=1 Tax=Reichenbachiella carrageenanivorans TaxID=2979869 RepID=A0ABY6D2Q4_9BACT|nr:sulfatase [Reichenbachiella carrageenanivorans]UXX79368.1 sulfatase [Reichenbachiella carrageenanivorans]